MASKRLFAGKFFAFAGTLAHPEEIVRAIISRQGGAIEAAISEKVDYVLSSLPMVSVLGNPYKEQFFPDFESQIQSASVYSIPVISSEFLQACEDAGKIVDLAPYLLFTGGQQAEAKSKLDPRVQEVVKLIFDKSAQQQEILEMSLDPAKLQNVSGSDITSAYSVLNEVEQQLQLKANKKTQEQAQKKLQELSTRFYQLVPHTKTPTIDSQAQMLAKMETLEALRDIQLANSMLKDTRAGHYTTSPIDVHYKKLKAKIAPLERWTAEYELIKQYVANTHAAAHKYFSVELEDVFEVDREGEADRYQPFAALPHHRLLWHGSRLSNFAGILSQGLRIAPPEAPVTGYFLGKGVYFADMVSKSAEYCHPAKEKPYALMLLCDVALGRPYQVAHTKFVTKADLDEAGFHSVKGCGALAPDPAFDTQHDGCLISLGHEAPTGVYRSELSHNEYVVYDVAQIRVKYLVKVRILSVSGQDVKALSLVQAN